MRKIIYILFLFLGFYACNTSNLKKVGYYKTGTFKTILKNQSDVSIAQRNDSIQIENYNGKKDTFYIKWKNDFEYILLNKHPKNALDSTPFHVKITKFDGDSYHFQAFYKGSNFKQEGTATKIGQ